VSEFEQIPFGSSEFADNPEPRCPCLLLLDTSESMQGGPDQRAQSRAGLVYPGMASDPLAMKRVRDRSRHFGPVQLVSDFQTPDQFQPPMLTGQGDTPMGAAIAAASR